MTPMPPGAGHPHQAASRLKPAPASLALLAISLFALVGQGCTGAPRGVQERPAPQPIRTREGVDPPIQFENVAQRAGIHFTLGHGGRSPLDILETAGGGAAFVDYDADGWPDILLVGPHRLALYHNDRNGKFTDVTVRSGLATNRYWMGCAVGDYDGDGLPDLFLTGYHCCALYRNLGAGRFRDVTRDSGISGLTWSMSALFADLTGHGRLDLFVAQYVEFDRSLPQICKMGSIRSACGPEVYPALHGRLFTNIDGRHFRETRLPDSGKTWGVLASDLLGTGRPALYLANDLMPGDLFTRTGGAWRDSGIATGTAFDSRGQPQGGMGVDSGDYDNDGRLDLLVTTFFMQEASLYHNDGNGVFTAASLDAGLSGPTVPFVKFGCALADFDNDGWLDIIVASGHVRDNVHVLDAGQTYRQPMQLFHNREGRFDDLSESIRSVDPGGIVGRGLAIGDYDRDGRLDVLVCDLDGDALLLHNVSPFGHWLTVRLQQAGANRYGLGAMLTLRSKNGAALQEIKTCGSVLSARDCIAHFGLGAAKPPVKLTIRWPDGAVQSEAIRQVDREMIVRRSVPARAQATGAVRR
jgi:hypothetical protein